MAVARKGEAWRHHAGRGEGKGKGEKEMTTITVTLLGDDRARAYPIAWLGLADITTDSIGEREFALVQDQDHETAVYSHPEHGWCSLGNDQMRDAVADPGYPPMDDQRLNAAY